MDIGVWGDSITYGAGDTEALGWVGRLRKQLEQGGDNSVYNRGNCGDTSRGLLKRFSTELATFTYPVDVVIFAIGMNDVAEGGERNGNEVPLEEFAENVRDLIMQVRTTIQKVSVIGITTVDESRTLPIDDSSTHKEFRNTVIHKYNEALQTVCCDTDVRFIDVSDVLGNTDLDDGLHPNSDGYEKLFAVISKNII